VIDQERIKLQIKNWGGDFMDATKDDLAIVCALMLESDPDDATTMDYLRMALDHIDGKTSLAEISLDILRAHAECGDPRDRMVNPAEVKQELGIYSGDPDDDPGSYVTLDELDAELDNTRPILMPDEVTEALQAHATIPAANVLAAAVRELSWRVNSYEKPTDDLDRWRAANEIARVVEEMYRD